MSLRTKTFIILLITLTCSLLIQSTISSLLLQSYESLEKKQMLQSLERIQAEFQSDIEFIHTITTGWAKWDHVPRSGSSEAADFANPDLPPQAMSDFQLHLFGFFDQNGRLLNLTLFDERNEDLEPSPALVAFLERHPFLHALKDQSQPHKGLILLPDGPMLLSSHPVVSRSGEGGVRGSLIFGRVLDEQELAKMAEQLHINLTVTRLDTHTTQATRDIVEACRLSTDNFYIVPLDRKRLRGHAVIKDISGHPALLLSAEQERQIYLQGLHTIRSFQWIIVGTGLLFGLIFLLLLERQILFPVRQFTMAVSRIEVEGNLGEHIPAEGSTEFREWSRAINRMLDSLARSQAELESTRQQLEQRVEERTAELEIAYNQLVHAEKLSVMGTMSASVAHEFGNPLFGIRNVLTHLQEKAALDEREKQLVQLSLEECERLKKMINRLKDFHRPSTNLITQVDLHEALDDILLLFHKDLRNKQIAVQRSYAAAMPAVPAVADQIKQVLINMLKNAEDAIPEAGGSIEITTSVSPDGAMAAIRIKDSGSGIAPEHLEKIFEPFFSTKEPGEGTGLGLPISFMIVKKHGGDISVESEPGNGTIFTITLPTQ